MMDGTPGGKGPDIQPKPLRPLVSKPRQIGESSETGISRGPLQGGGAIAEQPLKRKYTTCLTEEQRAKRLHRRKSLEESLNQPGIYQNSKFTYDPDLLDKKYVVNDPEGQGKRGYIDPTTKNPYPIIQPYA
jgi:hypothetical protein